MSDEWIEFSCVAVEQNIGEFYVGAMDAEDVIAISIAEVRRKEGRDIERYIGTQRDLSTGRVDELKQYVTTVDACFPTSVILAIKSDDAKLSSDRKSIRIRKNERVAKIIDGQHRIAGLEGLREGNKFQLNVTVFVDMDMEDQAMVFATINLKQTKVTKSLAYDLFEYTKSRSPQKTCHDIAKLLNSRSDSPLYQRIKILGKASGEGPQLITQSTFVDRLMRMITRNAMKDKDLLKRGKRLQRAEGRRAESLIFRDWFIDERDAELAKVVWNYFSAVRETWPTAWNNTERGYVLARTTGFAALTRFLPYIWIALGRPDKVPSQKHFVDFLKRSNLNELEITSENFKPGSTGEGDLLKSLKHDVFGNEKIRLEDLR